MVDLFVFTCKFNELADQPPSKELQFVLKRLQAAPPPPLSVCQWIFIIEADFQQKSFFKTTTTTSLSPLLPPPSGLTGLLPQGRHFRFLQHVSDLRASCCHRVAALLPSQASCPLGQQQQHVEQYMKCKHTWNLLTPEHSNGCSPPRVLPDLSKSVHAFLGFLPSMSPPCFTSSHFPPWLSTHTQICSKGRAGNLFFKHFIC